MTATPRNPGETARKAAVAAYEALPAILLAAALLAPAIAALAARQALPADFERQAIEARTGASIANQGNGALIEIREESRASLRQHLNLPKLS
jgi:hypothetical protein